jgi:hypothetical protein
MPAGWHPNPRALECVAEALGGAADLPELIVAYAGPSIYDLGPGPLEIFHKHVRTLRRVSRVSERDGVIHMLVPKFGSVSWTVFMALLLEPVAHESRSRLDSCTYANHPAACRAWRGGMEQGEQVLAEALVRAFVGPWTPRPTSESGCVDVERVRGAGGVLLQCKSVSTHIKAKIYDLPGPPGNTPMVVRFRTNALPRARALFPMFAAALPPGPPQRPTRRRPPSQRVQKRHPRRSFRLLKRARKI